MNALLSIDVASQFRLSGTSLRLGDVSPGQPATYLNLEPPAQPDGVGAVPLLASGDGSNAKFLYSSEQEPTIQVQDQPSYKFLGM